MARGSWAGYAAAACALAAVVWLVVVVAPWRDTAVSGQPSGAPSRAWELPPRSWDELPAPDPGSPLFAMQDNPLNFLAVPPIAGCPAPRTAADEGQWRADVTAQWDCLHRAWLPVLRRNGWAEAEPEVRFFEGEGDDSACGYLEAPAFYCSKGKGSVHFGSEHFHMATRWDLAVNEMVNHEYSHHLQSVSGITAEKLKLKPTAQLERRSELQATCMAAMQTWANGSVDFDASAYASWQDRLASMLVDDAHGSRESLTSWGTRGLYARGIGECNTWRADDADVG